LKQGNYTQGYVLIFHRNIPKHINHNSKPDKENHKIRTFNSYVDREKVKLKKMIIFYGHEMSSSGNKQNYTNALTLSKKLPFSVLQ
jgi:hypothetical protein